MRRTTDSVTKIIVLDTVAKIKKDRKKKIHHINSVIILSFLRSVDGDSEKQSQVLQVNISS